MRGLAFRYLFGELAAALVSGILIFSGILLINILFKAANLLLSSGIHFQHLLDLILSLVPHLLTMTTPMALLLALLLVYGRLAEHNELVALMASGFSYRKILAPGIVLSGLLTLFMLFMENIVAPRANDLERQAKLNIIRDSALVGLEEGVFNDNFPGHIIYVRQVEPGSKELQGIVINQLSEVRGEYGVHLEMTVLSRNGKVEIDPEFRFLNLRLFGGTMYVMGGETHTVGTFTHATLGFDIHEIVRKLSRGESRMKAFTTPGLAKEARRLENRLPVDLEAREGALQFIRRLWREFHLRQAIPGACFAIPWLAIPLGIWTRSGRKSLAFGLSLTAFFGYYLLHAFGKALIKNGVLSPAVGSWMPVTILLVVGLFLTFRVTRT